MFGISSLSETSRMHKLLSKDTSVQVEVLKRSDGTFTDSHTDTIKVLLDEHFPGNVIRGEITVLNGKIILPEMTEK